MRELHLLGRLDLRDASGSIDVASVRGSKRPALLCFLAAAGPGGFRRRDEIVALLWPEAPEDKARSALRSVIHALRSDLGRGVVRNRGRGEIGIDPAHLRTDLADFLNALERKDWTEALHRYGGVLLPGFHVDDAGPFMEWMEELRSALQRRALEAAAKVAARAEAMGRLHDAVAVARRAVELDPFDEAAHQRLIRLLLDVHDHAGALAVYRRLAERLWEEFEAHPAPETTRLVEGLVEASPTQEPAGPPPEPPELQEPPPGVAEPDHPRLPRRRRWALIGLVPAVGVAWLIGHQAARPKVDADAPVIPIAVFPFSVVGDVEEALATGLPRLLSNRLDIPGSFRSIDDRVIRASAGEDPGVAQDPDRAVVVARDVGARAYVLGTVVGSHGSYRITIETHAVADNDGEADRFDLDLSDEEDVFVAVDQLTRHVVSVVGPPGGELGRAAAVSTTSVPALTSYLRGERAFQDGRFAQAVDHFRAAVDEDSTFALGYYGLARAAEWTTQDSLIFFAADKAWERGADLPERFRLLIEAKRDFWAADTREAARVYRAVLARYPDDVEARYELADILFHVGPAAGTPLAEAEDGFRAVLAVVPTNLSARLHLVRILSLEGAVDEAESWSGPIVVGGGGDQEAELLGLRAAWRGDDASRDAAIVALQTLPAASLMGTLWRVAQFAPTPAAALPLVDAATDPSLPDAVRGFAYALRAQIEASSGKLGAAAESAQRASDFDPWLGWGVRALLASVPEYESSLPSTAGLVREGAHLLTDVPLDPDAPPVTTLTSVDFRLSALGWLAARVGDSATIEGVRARLAPLPSSRGSAIDVFIQAALAEDHRGPNTALDLLAPHSGEPTRWSYVRWALPFWVGRMLEEAGRPEEALAWYRSCDQDQHPSLVFRSMARLRSARILRDLGRTREAETAYGDFLHLWNHPDPSLVQLRETAVQELAALR